jgi:transposase
VKKAIAADGPPTYRRGPRGSVADAVEPRIRELLQACPTMPATVIAERIEWRYSIRTLSGRVAELRPIYLPPETRRQRERLGLIRRSHAPTPARNRCMLDDVIGVT